MTKTQEAQFAKIFLFSGTKDPAFRAALADARLEVLEYAAGETIYSARAFSKSLCAVLRGTISVTTAEQARAVPLRLVGRGETVGAAALFGAQSYPTEVRAKTAVTLCRMPQEMVEEYITTYPELALRYIGFLSDRIRFLNKKICSFTAGSVEAKVATYLLSMRVGTEISLTTLATTLNIGRASLYRALDCLAEKHIIEKKGRALLVTDYDALKALIKS